MGKAIFKIAHRNTSSIIYWHVDNEYVGQAINFHQMALQPNIGKHKLTLVDENAETLEKWFTIVE